jgi:hypothetical protein
VTDLDRLPDDVDALNRIIADMAQSAVAARVEIEKLRFELARLKRAQFGRSSEKLGSSIASSSSQSRRWRRTRPSGSPLGAPQSWRSSRRRSRHVALCPSTRRAKRSFTPHLACARAAADPCARLGSPSPRRWSTCQVIRHVRDKLSCRACDRVIEADAPNHAAALGLALVENGWRVLFTRTTDLELQIVRRDLALEAAIAKLDKYHLLVLNDLAHVSKDQAETSVLFELISARYERRSLLITANQPFGDWGKKFPDQAMTLAAIDRLVHHATILEMNVESYGAAPRSNASGDPADRRRAQQPTPPAD